MTFTQLFDKVGTLLYNDGTHTGYLIDWRLVNTLIEKWSRNRDADQSRVDEMFKFHHSGGYLPRIIHVADKFNPNKTN